MENRVKFIVNTSVEYFDTVPGDGNYQPICEFLENEDLTILAATSGNNGKVKFHHQIPNDELCLLFYKIPQLRNTDSPSSSSSALVVNQNIGILTLEGGMVKSIYNSVSRVYSPSAKIRKTEIGSELSGLLENLQTSLVSTLGLPPSGISSIKDEIKYWEKKLNDKNGSRTDRETAQKFIAILENIDRKIHSIENLENVEEFLDSSHGCLDDLWRLPYQFPQSRMNDLLDAIGNQLLERCIENLNSSDIWNLSSYHVNNLMSQCLDIVDAWIQLCDALTRLFWPNYNQHVWIGEPYTSKYLQRFRERLSEIRSIKNLYKQIATLLDDDGIRNMFSSQSPFKDINIFDTSKLGHKKWIKALQYFEQLLEPVDERIAAALKGQLHNHLSNPRQVIFIFSKFDTLIQRPTVLELLTIEREQFLQSLHILLQDLRKAMTETNMEPDTGHLSVICNECRWLKVVQYQIQDIEKVTHLISGREGFDQINKQINEIKEETESLLRTNFEIWSSQCSSLVRSGELRLRDDQPVVKFEKEGRQLMRVTFNPKLVTFCQDVREFENLGYTVPVELRSSAVHAAKFMSYARNLQQIATFHNTIGDRMIPCQRPIMLKNAIELSQLVQSETVAWNDEESVRRYVSTLQKAVSKLSEDNTLLVGYHEQAKRTVIKLMNTDLFTQSQVWKDEMRHLRELVGSLERHGYTHLDAFKLHWDHQLYKVLEYQYILGLVDMNSKLPDIHIEIAFRQRTVCFRPSEEEIREKYFSQLRRFIERPCAFRGLSDKSADLFKSMIELNQHNFGPLFEKAQELFEKLDNFKTLWMPWVALGCVDVDELCNIHLNTSDDWDRNFKECKLFHQSLAKIQYSEECIDCFVINILPLRSDIEFIGRRYWEALTNSLRSSILKDISVIQDFLQTSFQFLQNIPMDESSISDSGAKYEKMMTELPKVSEILNIVKGKDTCLASWCKERVSALAGILDKWEKLQPLIENHAVILQRQVDIVKDQIQSQIQHLSDEAEKFILRWDATIAELESNEECTLDLFKERQEHWNKILQAKSQLVDECTRFNVLFPVDVSNQFDDIDEKVKVQSMQWNVCDIFTAELEAIVAEEWTIYRCRPYILNEFLSKWEVSVNSSIDQPSKRIRKSVDRIQTVIPVLQMLQSDALTERHWAKIFLLLTKELTKPIHNILLKDILSDYAALMQASTEIENLVRQAASEQIVRQALIELDQWSVTASFKLTTHHDSTGNTVSLIKDYQEILSKIGDNQSLLQSAKNSAAFEAFSDQAELWESRLNMLDVILEGLGQSQRRWVYLEPVFGAGTLKNEEALFKRVDKDFRYIMREIHTDPRVISLTKIGNISTIVNSLESQLTRCQNNLMSYITEKRKLFPRFYFLGDDDLLEILGQATKDPKIIQKHVRKLFPGCYSLDFAEKIEGNGKTNSITSVQSAEGDILTLKDTVEVKGTIELWLNKLVTSIQETLKWQIFDCCSSDCENFKDYTIQKYPIQVLSTSRAVHFTRQTEKAITSMSLQKLFQCLNSEISHLTAMKNKSESSSLQKLKIRSLLYDLVYYVTIVEDLIENNVIHVKDWNWLKQMKFYIGSVGDGCGVTIRMVHAEFQYSYEFLGNPNKLVSTSLTHKCFLILTQAMQMGLGGNPFGPAGTGKTECVKALGSMMGRLVLVFNCDENVDTESMGLILTGLARCGAWGCFDEFNRLQEATLSAISMLIQPIQMAIKEKTDTVQIGDKNVQLNQHCGIFVTLNPAGEEYGGRQKLPGNIQALFRPIVMQQPEPKEIAKVILFVEGFQRSSEIGDRIVELFDLCSKILSTQHHYDWGLRELKTILLACGQELNASSLSENVTNDKELSAVVNCLRANTMAKLTAYDIGRFDMLLHSVFPEIEIITKRFSNLEQDIEAAFISLGLCPNKMQIEKALQLHEQLIKRTGVVVVGPPRSGKTTIITLLRKALLLSDATNNIRIHTISPKSMNRIQLLGTLDPDTRQWTDGVLTTTAVAVSSEPSHIHSWIICDGNIDPEWIEALNSVLDDNKLLTLPSGWRIQFGSNVNFIFETHDLSHASPATISRMGVVNMNNDDFPQSQLIDLFLAKEEFGDLLRSYVEEYFIPAAEWVEREYLQYSIPNLSRSCLVHCLFINLRKGVQTKADFCICLCRTLFGFLPTTRHNEFANFIFERSNLFITNPKRAELTFYNPESEAIEFFESAVNTEVDSGEENEMNLTETAQMKAYLADLRVLLGNSGLPPFLILGPPGSGKTLLIQHAVSDFAGYQIITINCSTQLTPAHILLSLKQNCITVSGVRGREYKPKQVRVVLFLKNIDLCYVDSWGTSEIVELLYQLIQRHGLYASNLEWINISGVQICGSISDDNSRLLKISPRFLALNNFLRVQYPSDEDMESITESRLRPIISRFKNAPNIQYVISGLLDFYAKIQEVISSASHRYAHYQFNPKIIMKLLQNLKYYPEDSFNEALFCEINSLFKDRMMTEEDVNQVDEVVRRTTSMRKLYMQDKIFFIPKSPGQSSLHGLQHDEWLGEIQKQIKICNSESFAINEPITEEFLEQAAKIARIISRRDSHLLVLGQAGGGHIEALYVAATFHQARVHLLHGGSGYTIFDFYTDLKMAMQTAALENQCTCLLVDHCWISFCPDIMKPIEAILEGSEIIDLFGNDLESVASSLKHSAQLEGYQESLASYFIERTKRNLHLVVVLDTSNSNINEFFNVYPALHRSMNILCVRSISNATREMLPKKFIESLSENNEREKISFSSYFSDISSYFMKQQPPKRFYQLIHSYFYIYCNLSQDIEKRLQKLQLGVDKLASAHSLVDTLKSNASKQEEALAEKRKLANDALEMISSTMRNANDQKTSMLELKKQAQVNSEQLKERQKVIQQELSEVEPILKEASAAVGQIKSEALSEIRSLRAPPEAIRDILEGVLRLMGIRDTSWNSMKTFLAKRGVKEDIRSLDPARINPENCEAVEKLLAAKSESFELRNAKRASAAAAPLASWVRASVRYSKVIQSIKPLEREQRDLQRNLDVAESEMQSLITGLDDVDGRVKELSARLNAYTQEAAVLEVKLEDARHILHSAEILIEKLSSEFQMWNNQLDEYKSSYKALDTKSLFISLAVNYLSHLTMEKRMASLEGIQNDLNLTQLFDIRKNLLTDQEQIIWESMGLARDAQVIESAAILRQILELPFNASPIPLVIDPTHTVAIWLEEFLRSKSLLFETISQNNERLTYTLELAVRFGKIIVIKDCHSIRPPLMQFIQGRFFVKFSKKLVEVGSKFVDFHENFRLVMIANSTKIDIGHEILSHLTCIPFTVTAVGLIDQLMSKAIISKNPELEQKRVDLLKNEGILLKRRLEIENKLLEELSQAQGDILKNENLLTTLNEVKETSSVIDKSLKESTTIREILLKDFNQLKDFCLKSSNFYIGLSRTYDISVEIFTNLFLSSLDGVEINENHERVTFNILIRTTFKYLARSTRPSSHLILAIFVCKNAFPEQFPASEWRLFVTNFLATADGTENSGIVLPQWIEKEANVKLKTLLQQSPELEVQLQLSKDYAWRTFIDEGDSMPGEFRLNFHRVLIAQIFRPDLINFCLETLVSNILGITLDSIAQPTMQQLADESNSDRPILVITQPENDPSAEIRNLALRNTSQGNYLELSIGRGMERKALDAVRQAAVAGKWICIRNVHLIPSWLIDLDRELEVMKKAASFRLWLICESTKGFSDTVIYKFTKILYEFPVGVKNKVRQTIQNYSDADFTRLRDGKSVKIRIALFIMYAVLVERRKYIPQGWSKWYEFGDSDLRAALQILQWLDSGISGGRPEWKTIQCLCENIAFGGKINNPRDLQILQHYLKEFFNSDVLNNRWSPLNIKVHVPTTAIFQDYLTAIAKFPDNDSLETFKLSSHSNISRNIDCSFRIIQELRRDFYQKEKSDESENESRNLEKKIKPILLLWKKLASKSTVLQTSKELCESDVKESPWKAFVCNELRIAAQCFQEIHKTLSNVHSGLKEAKQIPHSSTDANIFSILAENQVPLLWRKIWTGPVTATEYIKAIIACATEAEHRFHSDFHLDFGEDINLSRVFNCHTFFSCLKIACSSKLQKSSKYLHLHSSCGSQKTDSLTVKLASLKVDGAIFLYEKLVVSSNETRNNTDKSPEFYVCFKEKDDLVVAHQSTGSTLLPLYTSVNRKNFLCHIEVPTTETAATILLSGAALIISDY